MVIREQLAGATPPLPRAFFERPATEVAPDLLGCVLTRTSTSGTVAVRLTEVEAYMGAVDPASHAYGGRSARNATMFGEAGHAYVYFTYGMHHCMNLVCMPEGTASAVLLRAGEVVVGAGVARHRRAGAVDRDLARGPARLTVVLAVDRDLDGADVCDPGGALVISAGVPVEAARIVSGPRTGVSAAAQVPWRFHIDADPTVSPYRAHAPRRRARTASDPAGASGRKAGRRGSSP